MTFNIGVNVVESDGTASPSITGAAASVAGFHVVTQRGVPDQPVRVTSFQQFTERFGPHFAGGLGAYLVRGFFDNGGRVAYVNRVVDTALSAAESSACRVLKDQAGGEVLLVEAGYRGQADPGLWGRELAVKVEHKVTAESQLKEKAKATVTATDALPATVDMSALPPLAVKVDDNELTLRFDALDFANPAAATRGEITTAINKRTTDLIASLDGDKLVLTSTSNRPAATGGRTALSVTAANPKLGFPQPAAVVWGTPHELEAGGTRLARVLDFGVGDSVLITDSTRSEQVTLKTVNEATGAVAWSPDLVGPDLFDVTTVTVRRSASEFDLIVSRGEPFEDHVLERHTGLTMVESRTNYAPVVVNDPLSGSNVIRLTDKHAPGAADRPSDKTGYLPLENGADGTVKAAHFIGGSDGASGFPVFDPFDIQLLCCESTSQNVALEALGYCARRGDAMYVGAVPKGVIAGGKAAEYTALLRGLKVYGALYGPWITVPDPLGVGDAPRRSIPPVGHVLGVYARVEATRGIWKAPAGDEANLRGVLDVETRLSDADHTALVKDAAVNGVRPVPRAGIVIDASRTLSSDPRWLYVNVRLLFNYVKSSLRDGLRWVRQEPNRDALWSAVKFGTVNPFLTGLWRQGAFGTGGPEETFTVVVDATNNPPDQVEQGRLAIDVLFYPSRPAETIVISIGQQPSGGTVTEA
ncbi:phage tail sheath family protein [Streptomyces sp. NBC_01445]|uniref:phage tail sheath family protein n=1 Tax=Streptomyces sp. NBC_01445 TaxID=2903869 RepID=UPI002DDC01F4|nr:phage tail sheath C-terminal domain-containing protein [Streptomyces sp. NBC_01445]WSE03787.1 phage tail sheath subtilisin-like domain-containing protein [Streptomyces sp. NBC_01445]